MLPGFSLFGNSVSTHRTAWQKYIRACTNLRTSRSHLKTVGVRAVHEASFIQMTPKHWVPLHKTLSPVQPGPWKKYSWTFGMFRSLTCYFQQYQALAPRTFDVHSAMQGRSNSVKGRCCEEDNLATEWSLSGYSRLPTTALLYVTQLFEETLRRNDSYPPHKNVDLKRHIHS